MSNKVLIVTCAECERKTSKFYPIPTNKGKIYKCDDCYELDMTRSMRIEHTKNPNATSKHYK